MKLAEAHRQAQATAKAQKERAADKPVPAKNTMLILRTHDGRQSNNFTGRFPAIAEAVRGLNVDQASLIDGEAVVLQSDGRSDFGALLTKQGGAQATLGLGYERGGGAPLANAGLTATL
jgi:hypothetical protein